MSSFTLRCGWSHQGWVDEDEDEDEDGQGRVCAAWGGLETPNLTEFNKSLEFCPLSGGVGVGQSL